MRSFRSLTHWGWTTHICIGNLTIIGSDNGLSPGRHQAIIWTNDGILSIGPLGTNFSEILIGIQTFSFKKMEFKTSPAKWRPFCLGLNVLSSCIMRNGSTDIQMDNKPVSTKGILCYNNTEFKNHGNQKKMKEGMCKLVVMGHAPWWPLLW